MKDKNYYTEITEKLGFGMVLALSGGFMDAYSYTVHGKVFATGQTGNFVLVAAHLIDGDYAGAFHSLVPILSFWLGILISWHIFYSYFKENRHLWKHSMIAIELIALFIAGFIPRSYPDIIANTLVSFSASLQFCAFRKLGSGEAYACIFCTGNMRSCAENFYKGIARKDKQCMKKAIHFTYILISFFIGAIVCTLESKTLHQMSIWSVDIVLLSALVGSYVLNKHMLKKEHLKQQELEETAV
ncbi:YoaK family protein [Clostridium hydrogenum]|uniref:YoaK family protein n=1 Tax=Clostridium hydrogenum TaxID=2855764 RepID=UPI001F1FFEC8|nr:YoaK family protein [Clostridium hydrogenum]